MSEHLRSTHETFGLDDSLGPVDDHRGASEFHDHHEDHGSNDHLASIYESREDQFEAVVPFVEQGLARNERCLYVADDNTREEVVNALREGGIDVDAALDSGALSIHTKADTYVRTGEFEQEAMLDFWEETLAEAQDEAGYDGIRAAAEMTWALEEGMDLDRLVRYEAALNTLYPGDDYVVLCQYDRERFPADVIADVIRSHPLVVSDGTVCENVHYHPPEEFFDADRPSMDVDRTVEGLVSRARTDQALQERERYERELYEVTSDPDRSFDEKLQALFDLGCEFLDLDVGAMARVDPATDRWEVETVSGDHEHLVPGAAVALSETYCRLVADGSTAGVSDPVGSGFEEAKCYEEFGVNAYLGTGIELDGALDRTFFFVSTEPRETPFSEAERTFHRLMGQWIESELEQRQREDQLAALNTLSREVMHAETRSDVSESVVDAAETTLDLPVTAIALYDDADGVLRLAAATDAARELLDASSVLDRADGVGWTAFIEDEPKRESDPLEGRGTSVRLPVGEVAAFSLGDHGVFVAGSTVADGFTPGTFDFVETVARNTEAALDRADREQQLHEREATLAEQNETLERLDRINGVIRDIDQALVGASTDEEIMQAVCDRLVAADAYRFAWIGTHDTVPDEVTPEAWAGVDDGYLETVADDGSGDGYGPTGETVRTREVQVRNALATEPPFEPWRKAALERGYQACIAVPLRYQETFYGVLTVYAGRPDVFDGMEQAVLAELGKTIGYALNALERRRALVSEQSVELEFQLRNGDSSLFQLRNGDTPLFQLAAEHDCELEFESIVQRTDGSSGLFVRIRGAPVDEVLASGERSAEIDELTVVRGGAEEALFECRLRDSAFLSTLLDRGAMLRTFTATADEGSVVIRIPQSHGVRGFVDLFETQFEGAELVALREVDEPIRTQQEFEAEFRTRLTERQEEILQTAYVAGFFDWPRETTAQDLAELLDVSQPTVSRHVRAGEQKLFDLVFDRE